MRKLRNIIIGSIVVLPIVVHAQFNPHLIPESGQIGQCSFITGMFTWSCIPLYVAYLIQTIFSFIGTICLIQIIWAGYEMAIGGVSGDKEAGKNRLQRALIGLAFSVFVYLIVNMVVSVVI